MSARSTLWSHPTPCAWQNVSHNTTLPPVTLHRGCSTRVHAVRGGAVLERTDNVETMEPLSYELYTDSDLGKEFAEYRRATEQLEELAILQAQLMDSVQSMDNIWQSPQSQETESIGSAEARRARRQQARAARKLPSSSPSSTSTATTVPAAIELQAPMQLHQASQMLSKDAAVDTHKALCQTTEALVNALLPSSSMVEPRSVRTRTPGATSSLPALASGLSLTVPSTNKTARDRQQKRASRFATARADSNADLAARIVSGKAATTSAVDLINSSSQFIKSLTNVALLKPEQQKEVATIVQDFLQLKSIENELRSILKRSPTLAEWAKAAKADNIQAFQARVTRGQQAKALMLKANYRLVINVVKTYQNRGLSLQDLIAEGMQGLLRGVEKFEVDKGFRFSTYAHWWIRQAVTRALQDQARTVRLPCHVHEQLGRITIVKEQLTRDLQRPPTVTELAKAVDMTVEKMQQVMSSTASVSSLEATVMNDDGASEMKDMLPDERPLPDEVFADEMIKDNLLAVLNTLSPREATVLKMHWGLDGYNETTLEEIGQKYGITRERVRQLEARAMRQLKQRQHNLESLMVELQHVSMEQSDVASRASRGTRKT